MLQGIDAEYDAEDIVQEVFVSLYKNIWKMSSEEHIKAWLIRVTINKSKNFMKSNWVSKRTEMPDVYSNYLSKTELNQLESIDGIQEYSVMVGSFISEKEILTDEMLIINVSGSSEEKGVFTIQGEMTGDDLIYDIGYILDGHYTELDALNTDAVLDTKVEVKENTEFSWCITNRAESALNLSGMVSVIYDDLFYRNYGEGVIDIDTLCNITIHDISSLVAKEDLEGIYLYNCKTRESKKMAAALGNLEFQISTPGKYIIYAMTQESEVLTVLLSAPCPECHRKA